MVNKQEHGYTKLGPCKSYTQLNQKKQKKDLKDLKKVLKVHLPDDSL